MKKILLMVLILVLCLGYSQMIDVSGSIGMTKIMTNENTTIEQLKDLLIASKETIAQLKANKASGTKLPILALIGIAVLIINILLFIVRFVIRRITKTKKDDEFLDKHIDPKVKFINDTLSLFFGRLR